MLVYPQDPHERFLVDQLARKGVQVERRTEHYRALESIQWQVHVYGKASVALTRWCETDQKVPLHIFDWEDHYVKAGLLKDAAYLIRPDTYVALAGTSSNVAELEEYVVSQGLDISSE